MGLAVSAEHLVVVSEFLFLGEKPQTVLQPCKTHVSSIYGAHCALKEKSKKGSERLSSQHLTDLQRALAGGGQRQRQVHKGLKCP